MPVETDQVEVQVKLKAADAAASITASKVTLDVFNAVRSTCILDSPARYTKSKTNLDNALLTDRARAFWMLSSGWVSEEQENPTLYKVPFRTCAAPLGFCLTYYPGEEQYWHSFLFSEGRTVKYLPYPTGDFISGTEKVWDYDSKTHQLAVLVKHQFAVHVYDLTSGIEDCVYTHVAEEFGEAVGLAFSDGRIDVLIPQMTGDDFACKWEAYGGGCVFPALYSFNVDGSGIEAPLGFCRAAAISKTTFYVEVFGTRAKVDLHDPVGMKSKTAFWTEDRCLGKTTLADGHIIKSKVFFAGADFLKAEVDLLAQPWGVHGYTDLKACADYIASEALLVHGNMEYCRSRSELNTYSADACVESQVNLAEYFYGCQCRVSALGDYLLVGLLSVPRDCYLCDPETGFYLLLLNRRTLECVWGKDLRQHKVTGTARYDGSHWEEIIPKSGYTRMYTETKFEIQLFNAFGTTRIAFARRGKVYSPYGSVTTWEEYDINLGDGRSINFMPWSSEVERSWPMGFIFRLRDIYDPPAAGGTDKKYLCFTFRGKSSGEAHNANMLEVFQRDPTDTDYVEEGHDGYKPFAWLIAYNEEFSYPCVCGAVNLNVELAVALSKTLLRVAWPLYGLGIVEGKVDLYESLVSIFRSEVAFEDSNYVQSKVFSDDFWIGSKASLISNKELAFQARTIGSIYCQLAEAWPSGPEPDKGSLSIVHLSDDCTLCKGHTLEGAAKIRPAISDRKLYYITGNSTLHCIDLYSYREYFSLALDQPVKIIHSYKGTHPAPYYYFTLSALAGSVYYISWYGDTKGIAVVWDNGRTQDFLNASDFLPDYTLLISIITDGTYLYCLGYKKPTEGLWLIKFDAFMAKLDEKVIFKGKVHKELGASSAHGYTEALRYNVQFLDWDMENEQFLLGMAAVAGRTYGAPLTHKYGYGPAVFGADGQEKWWKNYTPGGVILTLGGLGRVYLLRDRAGAIKAISPKGVDLGITLPQEGGARFDTRLANAYETWIENYVQSKTKLVLTEEELDVPFPDIPEPTQVPREQRFVV